MVNSEHMREFRVDRDDAGWKYNEIKREPKSNFIQKTLTVDRSGGSAGWRGCTRINPYELLEDAFFSYLEVPIGEILDAFLDIYLGRIPVKLPLLC